MLSSYFNPTSVVPAAQTSSMIPLSSVRQIIQEVADTRANNLAFQAAVREHEAANVPRESPKPVVRQASSGRSGGRGAGKGGPINRRDMACKPPSMSNVPRVPRNMPNRVVWDVVKFRVTSGNSTSGVVEVNYFWGLTSNPQSSQWQALFDQFTIAQASVTWFSIQPPSNGGTIMELHTAIDFDSNTNLGTLSALDDYGTSRVDPLVFNKQVTRSCRPCVKPDISGVAGAAVAPAWIDTVLGASVPFYGIRSMLAPAAGVSNVIVIEQTIWFAFRNTV